MIDLLAYHQMNTHPLILILSFFSLPAALQIYFTLCAYALHQQLREEEEGARQNPYARVVKV